LYFIFVIFNKNKIQMNIIAFQKAFQDRDVISVNDILKTFSDFDTRRLVEWQEKKYIQKLINKYYVWPQQPLTESRLFFTANRLCSNSYVSLWSAMRWYGFIPEGVYQVFSVTTKQTHHFDTILGRFNYQHVKPNFLFGYIPIRIEERDFLMAEPEKAILDTFYLSRDVNNEEDLVAMRLNYDLVAERCSIDRLKAYAKAISNRRVLKLTHILIKQLIQ
jgi:predicted transcriptional regulator of viral defense system